VPAPVPTAWSSTPSAGSTRKLFITGGLALTAASGFSLLVSLYRERLERTAALTHRSVAHVLASTIAIALPPISDLPEALADELAGMSWLSDEALRAATQPTFTPEQQKRLSELNNLEDECPLTEIEQAERAALLAEYERSVLRRAQAFAVLAQRGYQTPDYTELTPAT